MIRALALSFLALAAPLSQARAQVPVSHCIAIADATPGGQFLHRASFRDPVPEYSVRISYLTHSAFLIQSPGGIGAITDYPGHVGSADYVPDVVTMNHAHSSHYTSFPDPEIPHVLKGWSERYGEAVDHLVEVGDMLVRNVSTDIRSGSGGREENGNSIFIFEVAGLCIGHLGHLHHEPNDEQYAAIGRLDVVMVPVDGGMTLDTASMVRVVERLRASIVLPMHWFSGASLGWFLDQLSSDFAVVLEEGREIEVSLKNLPERPTIMVLRPQPLVDP
ncbi:L-ascorbate metabolism protein UlaG, beta-lactamase superfamily [Pseudooceanicola antarcticus]|uniref:L-ascorbate metabolism protein UlaG, beta-lactamase superfamily n=1 Tax=Pseudooceanicola antarcticus TaxID=1247613 RepID=A0A285ITF8_9RHOB|nr:MBL fold metallo-hydrolase [Pseudooceanicola antarcticus]PJE31981.1 Zn-dependent hydrolase [Pseudooceanicola antarcticus]SNY51113.1 L-ascorbate metabolism protein UlaG, beta-lactamase superfamily [Pseudooceanicola antarcticus]